MPKPKLVGTAVSTLVAVLLLLAPGRAPAQDLVQAYEVTPRSDAGAAFESALRQHAEWREQNGDPWSWNVYQVVQGKHLGTYYARSSGHEWADLDAYYQGFEQEAGPHFEATVGPLVKKTSASIWQTDTTHTRLPEEMTEGMLVSVTIYHLKAGKQQDFMEAFGQFHEAAMDADYDLYYVVEQPMNGIGGPQVEVAVLHENWADFEQPTTTVQELLTEAYGEEETQSLFQKFSGSFHHYENMVVAHRPDLSVEGTQ